MKLKNIVETGEPELLATDKDPRRLKLVEDNVGRLGIRARVACLDWCQDQTKEGLFDLVWSDVPCSATGIIAKHPEIALRNRLSDLEALTEQQRTLLDNLWQHVAPGGFLVYSTCSTFAAENDEQVDSFCQRHPDAQAQLGLSNDRLKASIGGYVVSEISSDVMYVCVLKKTTLQ